MLCSHTKNFQIAACVWGKKIDILSLHKFQNCDNMRKCSRVSVACLQSRAVCYCKNKNMDYDDMTLAFGNCSVVFVFHGTNMSQSYFYKIVKFKFYISKRPHGGGVVSPTARRISCVPWFPLTVHDVIEVWIGVNLSVNGCVFLYPSPVMDWQSVRGEFYPCLVAAGICFTSICAP